MGDNSNKEPPATAIKLEPGSYKRLPSFRTPRDLKLTEFQKIATSTADAKKKVYKPNLNVQRKKQNDDSPAKESQNSESKPNERGAPSERGGRRERAKKKQPNLIQSTGVFSEGLAPSLKTGRWNSRFSDSSAPSMLERPKLKGPIKVNKEEEALVMKELLRDDFIDDPNYIPDSRQCPIRLPLKSFGGDIFYKKEEDVHDLKGAEPPKGDVVKVKVEVDTEEGAKEDPPPLVAGPVPRQIDEMVPLKISQLIAQSDDSSFIFFQLPHCMPKEKTFLPAQSKTNNVTKPQVQGPSTTPTTNPPPTEVEERCVLKNLPEGKIGKLQILKSGQARLVLGDAKFIVDPGTQPAFKQDVIALVDLASATKTGNMVHIGNITSRMIVSPDWESLLHGS